MLKGFLKKAVIFIVLLLIFPFVARCAIDGVKWVGNYYVGIIFPGAKKFQEFKEKLPDFKSWRDKWSGEDTTPDPAPDDKKGGWKWRLGTSDSLGRWIEDNIPAGATEEEIGHASIAFWDAGDEIKRDPIDSIEEALAVAKKYLFAETGERWRTFLAGLTEQIKEIPITSSGGGALSSDLARPLSGGEQNTRDQLGFGGSGGVVSSASILRAG